MTDIAQWLGDLGLEQYAGTFAENGVDIRAVAHLTEQDLKDLGVLLGHRRLLLAAIANLATTGAAPDTSTAAAPKRERETAATEAERRTLTVMFCDLVGSTELSARLDVEDYREAIRTYHEACAAAVSRYDGYIAKFMGDGILVYFGYPVAHDDDARRAVGTALDIAETIPKLDILPDRSLSVRIGIATGEVVVGDVLGEGEAEERSVLGMTPNLAARLQGVAGNNEIVIADTTWRRLRDAFSATDLGVLSLKGIAAPTQAWRIDGEREDAASGHAVPFVGRASALTRMSDAWDRARSGHAVVLHVTGQPGSGKSRLVGEFASRAGDGTIERWICSAFHRNAPLHPLPATLPIAGETDGEAGEAHRRAVFETVAAALSELASRKPLLLVVEDAHWIDPTTEELLETLPRRLADSPVLIVVVTRLGDMTDRLSDSLHGTRIELGALDGTEAAAIVDAIAGNAMSDDQRREILARAGGLPLFVEELTRVVADSGAAAVPASLEESLLARLDALGPGKRVAQLAAVFGESFGREDLAALSECRDIAVAAQLDRLRAADLLIERNGRLAFRHALIRDIAYGTLLRGTRQRVHGEIADQLLHQPDRTRPETIAGHLDNAGRHVEAVRYWHAAASRSAKLWAHAEAAGYYESALAHSGDAGDDAWELATRLDLVESLRIVDRYEDALSQLDRAEELALKIGTDRDRLRLHLLRGNILFPLGDADRCIASHEAALEIARRMDDPEAEARALSGIADAHFSGRRIVSAEAAYDNCVRTAEAHGLDAVTLANVSLRGHMRIYLCRLAEARVDCERAVEMSLATGNRRAELMARGSCLGKALMEAGELAAADRAFADAVRLAAELGAHRYEALNLAFRGKVALDTGAREDALAFGRTAADIARETAPRFCLPIALGVVGRATDDADTRRRVFAEAEEIMAGGCVSHNPLWFYRDAALAAAAHGWSDETRRYAASLRAAFAVEPLPWCDLIADGTDALALFRESGNATETQKVSARSRALGFHGWARTLEATAAAMS